MAKPDFMIAGFNRSGTSTLHSLLDQHPDIFMSTPKEIHFFDRNDNFSKGLSWYENHFNAAAPHQMKGDATPSYIFKGVVFEDSITQYKYSPDDDAVIRIAKTYPDIKLILSIRHPVRNTKSHLERTRIKGLESADMPLEQAIKEELDGLRRIEETYLCYYYLTNYALHIRHLLAHFPRENILFLNFENWTINQQNTLDTVSEFLGIEPHLLPNTENLHLNTGISFRSTWLGRLLKNYLHMGHIYRLVFRIGSKKGYDEITPEAFAELEKIYAEGVKELSALTGLDFSNWNIPPHQKS
jgi:hypothetical protein